MAAGDIIWFDQFYEDVGLALHDLANDALKLGLIDSTQTPAANSADPRWGAGGTTNFATDEVAPGGNYAAGGPTIANTTYTLVTAEGVLDGDDVAIAQDASNPTDARWGILYNDTDAGKRALGAVDLGAVLDLSTGPFSITWHADGIMNMGVAA